MCGCGEPAPISDRNNAYFGYVKGEAKRFIGRHNCKMQPRREWSDDDWHVEDRGYETPCHIWHSHLDRLGYARFGRHLAYRMSYERTKGPIPEGLDLDHLCRNPACINPDHLEAVTHRENLRRGANAKITYDIADEMKILFASGMTQAKIAERFGVEKRTVWRVTSGRSWDRH